MKNLRKIKGNWYYRLKIWNGVKEKETPIPLKTKNKTDAIRRAKIVLDNADDLKSGVIQKFQWEEYFPWLNDTGTSILVKRSVQDIIPDYLAYRQTKVRSSTANRDRISLNQLTNFFFKPKPIEELSYKDIEGADGLIQHLRNNGYKDSGINITLRHLRIFFNWMYNRERLIAEPIRFDMIPEGEQLYCYFNESELQAIHSVDSIDDFFKRCFFFYQHTGCRPIEPFIGELVGDWLIVDSSKSKGKNVRQIQLSEKLKNILIEMQSFRDSYSVRSTGHKCPSASNERAYERISKTLKKVIGKLKFNGKKLTLKSFRHTYGIVRVYETGNIFQVAMEMGHKNVTTTQLYLRFPRERVKQDFPSLEVMEDHHKKTIRVTDCRATNQYLVANS